MKKVTFDPARNLDLYFRIGMNGSKVFTFKDVNGDPYDLTGLEFSFRSGFVLTLDVVDNTITFSIDEDEAIKRPLQFWSLVNVSTGQTWLCGNAIFTDTQANEITESEDITINLTGEVVEVTITAASNNLYQGDWDPVSEGSLPTGALMGQRWRLTDFYKGFIGTIEAAINNPTNDDDWNYTPKTSI